MGIRLVVFVLVFLAAPAFAAGASSWRQIESAGAPGEVATWVRPVEDSPIKEFRGEVVLPVGPVPVLVLLADADALDEWIFQCSHAERLSGHTRDRLYLRFDLPWPVRNRDVVVENRMSLQGGALLLRSQSVADVKPGQQGLVRIPALDNRFLLTPLGPESTRVEFRTFVDPGGSVPAWLSNFVATKAPLRTLRGMRGMVKKQPWRDAGLADLPALPAFRAMDFQGWLDNAVDGK